VSSPAYSLGKSVQAYACHSGFGLTGSSDLPSKMAWASIASSFVAKQLSAYKGNVPAGLSQL